MEHHVIGIGQGGGRLANLFSKFAKNTIVINSNEVDLEDVDTSIPRFLLTDEKGNAIGVGANPDFGAKLFKLHKENLSVFLNAAFTTEDLADSSVWIFAALGGGTGSSGVIPVTNAIHSMKPMILNVVIALPSEQDGINKVRNSLDILFDVYTKLCVDNRKANLFILDNANYPTLKQANATLMSSLSYLFTQFPEVKSLPDGQGHADERDLMTVLKQKSGCVTLTEGEVDTIFCDHNRYYFNQYFHTFLGLDYEIAPTGVWLRDHTNGKNRVFIKQFMNDHKSSVLFLGEYQRLHTQRQIELGVKLLYGTTIMLQTGLPLPPVLVEKRKQLIDNYKEYKERTDGRSKLRTANKLGVGKIKL